MAAWAEGVWATDVWYGTAWATTTTPVIEVDTHDGGPENKRFRKKKAKLREDLALAYNKTLGIEISDEIEPAQMVQALEDSIGLSEQTIAGIEQRVIEKLIADYRQYEQEKAIYDRRVQEEEWDLDAMLAIAHLVH